MEDEQAAIGPITFFIYVFSDDLYESEMYDDETAVTFLSAAVDVF